MERQTIKDVQELVDADNIQSAMEANYNAITDKGANAMSKRYTAKIERHNVRTE